MATLKPERLYSLEEYLALEEQGEERLEFEDGVLVAMAGEPRQHNYIVSNLVAALWEQTRAKKCRLVHQNVKLQIASGKPKRKGVLRPKSKLYYPDLMIACGPAPDDPRIEYAPCFLLEVLSPSTASRDKGLKMESYLSLKSLEVYILVDPDFRKVEVYRRTAQGWLYEMLQDGAIKIPCIGARLSLEQIYSGLDIRVDD
jgi:Uma2 family endonuclease